MKSMHGTTSSRRTRCDRVLVFAVGSHDGPPWKTHMWRHSVGLRVACLGSQSVAASWRTAMAAVGFLDGIPIACLNSHPPVNTGRFLGTIHRKSVFITLSGQVHGPKGYGRLPRLGEKMALAREAAKRFLD